MRSVALLIFPGVQALDVFGPSDVFSAANVFLPPESQYQIRLIATERGALPCSSGLRIHADQHFSEAEDHHDLLLVPGGPAIALRPLEDAVHAWLKHARRGAQRFGAICNGTLTLARAGLLDGRSVTTHWNSVAMLSSICPTARVEADRVFVQDGDLYTSAGVTAGVDLSLYLLTQDHGPELALRVAKRMVVFLQRAGGQAQFSEHLTPFAQSSSPIAKVQQYVLAHLAEELSIPVLAMVAEMSMRHFSRVFVREARVTPAEFVESARIDAARVMLENSGAPLKTIATRCGMRDVHHLRMVFKRRLGITPQQYRFHFGSPAPAARTQRHPAVADLTAEAGIE